MAAPKSVMVRGSKATMVAGSDRKLKNGARGALYQTRDGKRAFRIYQGAPSAQLNKVRPKAGQKPRKISANQAKRAFNKFYKDMSNFRNEQHRNRVLSYDTQYSSNVVNDARYLRSPHKYDFQGVDAGPKTRKALSSQARRRLASNARKARAAKKSPVRRRSSGSRKSPVRRRKASASKKSPVRRRSSASKKSPVRRRKASASKKAPVRRRKASASKKAPVRRRKASGSKKSPARRRSSASKKASARGRPRKTSASKKRTVRRTSPASKRRSSQRGSAVTQIGGYWW